MCFFGCLMRFWRKTLARMTRRGPLAPLLAPALRLRVQHNALPFPIPLRIAILSDLHFGFGPSTHKRADQIRRRVQALSADLVVFLGDLAGGYPWQNKTPRLDQGCAALSGYSAPLGCFAVLGNHDWRDDPEAHARQGGPNRATPQLEAHGWQVLGNRAQEFPGFWLAGIDSQRAFRQRTLGRSTYTGLDQLDTTLAPIPDTAPLILLAHEPDIFSDLPNRVQITLSGHTHGGQIRPFDRPLVVPSTFDTRFAYGLHRIGPRQLIVSGGLGCSGIPLRYGITPEITCLDLSPSTNP